MATRGSTAAALGAWIVFEDEAGFSMTPPTSRTWARRGSTPVIRIRGRSQRRFSIAALCCCKAGERSRLIYRPKRHTDHKSGGRKSFARTESRDLLIAAHQQLGKPIVLIWDNLNVHKDRRMRAFIDAQNWITAYYLPPYAPDLNPVEGIWPVIRRTSQANTAHWSRAMRGWVAEQNWLTLERLPAYAPELTPVELLWSSLKKRELANLVGDHLADVADATEQGIHRTNHNQQLPWPFLTHTGLTTRPPHPPNSRKEQ